MLRDLDPTRQVGIPPNDTVTRRPTALPEGLGPHRPRVARGVILEGPLAAGLAQRAELSVETRAYDRFEVDLDRRIDFERMAT